MSAGWGLRARRRLRALTAAALLALAACAEAPSPANAGGGGDRAGAAARGAGADRGGSILGMSPADEARIGREQHPKVMAQFGGPYEDRELQAYVERVGNKMKNTTELKDQEFTFTVLDSDVVNAFALPGGYVYVSRGLLALARDEAELAGVLGHEVGHVVARHTAQRYGRAQVGALGGTAGQILGGLAGAWLGGEAGARIGAQLGAQGAGLAAQGWVQGFSREQEYEADQLGIQYLQAAGYEPRAMASFLGQLGLNDRLEGARTGRNAEGAVPGWLRSHPRTAERVTRAAEVSAEDSPGSREQGREPYLAAIDGLLYGDSPAQGFVRGRTFEHPELGFRFTAPEGFTLKNTPAAVIGQDGRGRFMQFDMAQGESGDPESFIEREWAARQQVQNVQGLTVGGLDAAVGFSQVQVSKRPAEAMLAAIEAGDGRFYKFVYGDASGDGLSRSEVQAFQASLQTFARVAKGGTGGFTPTRVRIHTVRSGETQESVARLMQVDQLPLETFRTLNGLEEGKPLRAGEGVKILVRG